MIHGETDTKYGTQLQHVCCAHFTLLSLDLNFRVGQVRLSRPRQVTQRVGVGMKPGVGHKGPEEVDQSLGGHAPLQ